MQYELARITSSGIYTALRGAYCDLEGLECAFVLLTLTTQFSGGACAMVRDVARGEQQPCS